MRGPMLQEVALMATRRNTDAPTAPIDRGVAGLAARQVAHSAVADLIGKTRGFALEDALAASENRDRESQARIADLGSRLNVALAQKVQELARYRSDFFGRLRQILGNRPDIRIVGDRFVLQSEVLFPAGSASLKPEAGPELDRIAGAILDLAKQIPADIPWVLRIDGHTDARPIASAQFPSNWALSAARAIAVVQAMVAKGIPPQHLLAAAFGEFQPIEAGTTEEVYARNRRIEMKLTER